MLSYERQQQILEILKEQRSATVETLCSRLYSSGATIRRDLTEMENKGLIMRVRGGAALIEGANQDSPLLVRSGKNRSKKEVIANLALPLIQRASTLFFDSSSTVTFLAERLGGIHDLSVVTNGLATIRALEDKGAKVFCCGGLIQNNSAIVGQSAVEMIGSFCADLLFFSCCGLSCESGSTEASEDSAAVKKQMVRHAKKRILLCDSTKFEQTFFCRVCGLEAIDLIITDQRPPERFLQKLGDPARILYPR